MKLVTMNPWAASLGGRSGNAASMASIWPSWLHVQVVDLDEGHDRGRDGGEDDGRGGHGAEQQLVRGDLSPLLAEDREDQVGRTGGLRSLSGPGRPAPPPGRGTPARGSPPPRSRPGPARRARPARGRGQACPPEARPARPTARARRSGRCGRRATDRWARRGRRVDRTAVELDPGFRRPRPTAQLSRGPLGQEVALQDADPVAEPLGLVEVVGAHQDRPARVAEAGDDLTDGLCGLGVQAAGRLVEVDDPRLVEQRPGDGDALSHPLREAADPPVGGIGQSHDSRYRSTAARRAASVRPYRRP